MKVYIIIIIIIVKIAWHTELLEGTPPINQTGQEPWYQASYRIAKRDRNKEWEKSS